MENGAAAPPLFPPHLHHVHCNAHDVRLDAELVGKGGELTISPTASEAACNREHTHTMHLPQHSSFVRAIVMDVSIAIHSVIIGVALGVNVDVTSIRVLMTAYCFHQAFEGVGLGVVISSCDLQRWKKNVLIIIFCLTTPVGIAVGTGVQSMYNEYVSGSTAELAHVHPTTIMSSPWCAAVVRWCRCRSVLSVLV